MAGVSGGLVGGLRAHQDHFRGFDSHRVHMLAGAFSCTKIELGKARERESATFDEKSTSSGDAE